MKIKQTKIYIPTNHYRVSDANLVTSEVLLHFSKSLTENRLTNAHKELATIALELSNMFRFKHDALKAKNTMDNRNECVRQIIVNLSKQFRGKRITRRNKKQNKFRGEE